jgi:hypothetical protein
MLEVSLLRLLLLHYLRKDILLYNVSLPSPVPSQPP